MNTADLTMFKDLLNFEPNDKRYFVYDVNGNVTDIYVAALNTINGGTCLRQRYTYDVNNNLIKSDYTDATWNYTWDI